MIRILRQIRPVFRRTQSLLRKRRSDLCRVKMSKLVDTFLTRQWFMPHSVVKHNIFVFWPLVVIPHWTYIFFCYSSNSWNISRPSLWVPRPCTSPFEFAHRIVPLSSVPTYFRTLHCHNSVRHHYSYSDGSHIVWLPHGILCLCTASPCPSDWMAFLTSG